MTSAQIKSVTAGLGAVSVLTFLFIQQRPVDPQEHNRFERDLQQVKQLDAEISRDLLSSRYELAGSYDLFVEKFRLMRRVRADLNVIPSFIKGSERQQIDKLISVSAGILAQKERLLETFKSENAILKNSLRYFPVLIASCSREAEDVRDSKLQSHLTNLLRDVLLYDISVHSDLGDDIKAEVALLGQDAERNPSFSKTLSGARAHALTIADIKPRVEAITEELNALPTGRSIDAIYSEYLRAYEHSARMNSMYRLFLYFCSITLLGYAANRTVQLVRSRVVVERSNQSLHEANAELHVAKTGAEAANRAKSAFLSTMSHEIRTPMNAILGYAQLMVRDESLSADAKANLQIIGRSGDHLLSLINDVLDMSKIEAGHVEVKPTTFDLPKLLEDLAALFRLRAAAKSLRFEMVVDGEPCTYIVGDEPKIRQALINLLGNAIKFTKVGHVDLHVTLYKRETDQFWLVARVEDSGPGISEEDQRKLFEPFIQTSRAHQGQEGTGLGLAITRKFARLLGGDATVHSEPGVGSTFRFEVPVSRGDSGVAQKQTSPRRVVRIRPGSRIPEILVVDDLAANRGWLRTLLTYIGFSVRTADNGEAAIRDCQQSPPDLILMDIHMPVMDGLEATRRIKATPNGKAIRVIVITASAMDNDRTAVSQSGADAFLSKPCREDELLERISNLLGVVYDYEEPSKSGSQSASPVLRAEKLRELPVDLLEALRDATLSGNKRMLDRLIDRIREGNDIDSAEAFQQLADNYEYDALTQLLEESCRR